MWQGTNCYQTLAAPDTGVYTFRFDYKSQDAAGSTPNQISWILLGYTASDADDRLTYGGAFDTLAEIAQSGTLLASGNFQPGNTGWQSFKSNPFSLPEGFSRLVIGIRVNGVQASHGDQVCIDDVAFNTL